MDDVLESISEQTDITLSLSKRVALTEDKGSNLVFLAVINPRVAEHDRGGI